MLWIFFVQENFSLRFLLLRKRRRRSFDGLKATQPRFDGSSIKSGSAFIPRPSTPKETVRDLPKFPTLRGGEAHHDRRVTLLALLSKIAAESKIATVISTRARAKQQTNPKADKHVFQIHTAHSAIQFLTLEQAEDTSA